MRLALLLPQERERDTELCAQSVGAVAHDRQTAALIWPVVGHRGRDDVAARLDRVQDGPDVGLALLGFADCP